MELSWKVSSPGTAWLLALQVCSTEERQELHPSIHPSCASIHPSIHPREAPQPQLSTTKATQRTPADVQPHQTMDPAQQPEPCTAKIGEKRDHPAPVSASQRDLAHLSSALQGEQHDVKPAETHHAAPNLYLNNNK